MDFTESATQIAIELLKKSGVREWDDVEAAERIANTAGLIASLLIEETTMALPDYFKVSPGTAKVIKNSGGDAAITLASLANGNGTSTGARQAVTLDLGSAWARRWRIITSFEIAATPTAGNAINLYASWSSTTGAGQGNTTGTDAAYTGYSNNIDNAAKHLEWMGAHICTAQVTTTVQKSNVAVVFPKGRYVNVVIDNRSGAALHSTETNQSITFMPLEESIQDAV